MIKVPSPAPRNKLDLLLAILAVVFIVIMFIIGFATHSFRVIFPYAAFLGYLGLGGVSIFSGLRNLRERQRNSEQISWYKQSQINQGIAFLLLGLFILVGLGIASKLPNALGDLVLYIAIPILGIPFIVFIVLSLKYRASLPESPQAKQ